MLYDDTAARPQRQARGAEELVAAASRGVGRSDGPGLSIPQRLLRDFACRGEILLEK